jgi:hypothetical protein
MGVLTKSDKEWLYQQRQHTWPYGQQTAVAKALAKAHGLLFTEELHCGCSLVALQHFVYKTCYICILPSSSTKAVLASKGYVEEAIGVFVFVIDGTHKRACGRQDVIDEHKKSLLRRQLNALANHVHELACSAKVR